MKATSCLLFLMHALIAPGQAKPDSLIPLPPLHTITPSSDRNYTIHYRPHLPVKSISRRLGLSEAEATINYFDGLGRCIQTVETGATPARLDLIKPVIPDFCNRQGVKDYIPYQGTTDKGLYTKNAQEAQNNYYAGIFGQTQGDACAYTEKRYEQSGAARLIESSRPGNAFRLSAGHTLRYSYALNTANEVRIYTYDNGSLNGTGYYPSGYLYKQETTDEDNRRKVTFTDHRGNTVLERLCISSGNTLDTYYIYDTFGRPVCIIPPALGGKAVLTASEIAAYCYRYAYDKRGNVTERSLPGLAPEKITYNDAGLPVARDQDNRHFTTTYDSHNRLLNEYYRYANGNSITVLQRAYDTYPSVTGLAFTAITGYDPSYDTRTNGLLTYEKERILDGSTEKQAGISPHYIERCFYYDKKGRIIQQVEKNHLGGTSRYSYAYDFVGNITAEREEHTVGNETTTIEKRNTYDHASRLLSAKIFLNGAYRGKVGYGYDAPGQLTKRSYGEDILTEQISYDIQGRTTSRESPLFRIGLRYEKPLKAAPRYAGDIAEWTCSYMTEPEQTYTFNYDGAGRFTGGNHYENGVLVNKYAEQGIAYDKNGNILSLKRFNNGALVDNLTYTYSGNRLSSLTEAATPATGDIYLHQNAATATYDYDGYGNLIKDSRKNLNFEYNILNLIHSVKQGTGLQAEYEYAYTGSKLRVTASDGKGYAYLGSLVYMCTGSSYIFECGIFGEGTVDGSGICYHLKDHLGSIRAVIDGNGKLLEANDYYAFGQRQPRSELPQLAANRFKYNGKELQTVGNLGFLDYGARMYDAPLGRWFNADPLCEKYYSLSPYVYCGNSPIRHIDPDGMDYWSTNDPDLIAALIASINEGNETHDFSRWHHATDAEFTGRLTYNDKTHKYYTYYTTEINGISSVIGLSFNANILPGVNILGYEGAIVSRPISGFWEYLGYYSGLSGYDEYSDGLLTWKVNTEGRITGIQPKGGIAPTPGLKSGAKYLKGLGRVGGNFHKATKGGASIKETVLKAIGKNKYMKSVGRNPNIRKCKDGYLYLEGTGPFKGKTYKTDLLFKDFFD